MSKHSMSFRKERAIVAIEKQLAVMRNEVKSRNYLEPTEAKSNDLFMAWNKRGYIFKVEKVTDKTITVSEARSILSDPKEFTYGHNPKRVKHDDFITDYLPFPITEKDITRANQLNNRMKFIYDFFRKYKKEELDKYQIERMNK